MHADLRGRGGAVGSCLSAVRLAVKDASNTLPLAAAGFICIRVGHAAGEGG